MDAFWTAIEHSATNEDLKMDGLFSVNERITSSSKLFCPIINEEHFSNNVFFCLMLFKYKWISSF